MMSASHFLPQIDVNTASSSVVRGIMGLVVGYISLLVVDMAFFMKVSDHKLYRS